ncbi:saccharopine dehydrogenase NADP-binding domain-containing protein [Candidatus Vidania fulgoroideorum]
MYKIVIIGLGNVSKELIKKLVRKFKNSEITIAIRKNNIDSKRIIESLKYKEDKINIVRSYHNYIKKGNIIIELIGDNIYSKDIMLRAIINKCILITANKNLIYKNINNIGRYLNKTIFFEASIGGGVQIVNMVELMKKVLEIKSIYSIINGTTNYILSNIKKKKFSLKSIIRLANKKGISERNPTKDLKGYDNLNKITILSNIILKIKKKENIKSINMFGIGDITKSTLKFIYYNRIYIRLVSTFKRKKNIFHIETLPYIFKKENYFTINKSVYNTIIISTKNHGKFTLKAKGAGPKITSISIIKNLIKRNKENIYYRNKGKYNHVNGIVKTKMVIIIRKYNVINKINTLFKTGIKCKFMIYKKELVIITLNRNCIFRITKVFILIRKLPILIRII